ncbi:MAG: tRNA 2-thiouridine(34) synthase MnmA [Tissierellia bacterium]|nr:tRNA 2-thiouridine(34) synthase MnmA [Tissierellia bacterium]
MKTALIAMSGGVDSSVAALLMKEKGYDCMGTTLKLFNNDDTGVIKRDNTCCSLDDIEDARSVAFDLDIPYYVFNFTSNFKEEVMERFVCAYESGFTPNPCIDCNRYIKFEHLYDKAKELGIQYVVTGHYARVEYDEDLNRYILKKGLDEKKDQSYVLYSLTQEQLAHTKFPVGELTKDEVRELAEKSGFINAAKKDSQDICFVLDGDYAKFIENYRNKKYDSGDFVDSKGNVLGEHDGIIKYTIGQRKGLGISSERPLYVTKKDMKKNKVVLGHDEDLFSSELVARNINLITIDSIEEPLRLKAKIRYNQVEQWATVTQLNDDEIKVVFDEPQRAIAKGQAVVLYDGDTVVGGGTII